MDFDHIHFYVHDAKRCRHWFTKVLGFQYLGSATTPEEQVELVGAGRIFCVFSSPLSAKSAVSQYLQHHSPGVFDLAFRVRDVQASLTQAEQQGATMLQPLTVDRQRQGILCWGKVKGWGALEHTLVERSGQTTVLPSALMMSVGPYQTKRVSTASPESSAFLQIDHAVLNVGNNELQSAVSWYQQMFGFQTHRYFDIQTHRSGLRSEVLIHPQGQIKFPINEPTSMNSQIQEFLDVNQGSGIQHIALGTSNIVDLVTDLSRRGLTMLDIPPSYYQQLREQLEHHDADLNWAAIEQQNILVDFEGGPESGILLQTFTHPIFKQPTFFFELIERQRQARGFGQRNFLALFQAMEREQQKRGVLL